MSVIEKEVILKIIYTFLMTKECKYILGGVHSILMVYQSFIIDILNIKIIQVALIITINQVN